MNHKNRLLIWIFTFFTSTLLCADPIGSAVSVIQEFNSQTDNIHQTRMNQINEIRMQQGYALNLEETDEETDEEEEYPYGHRIENYELILHELLQWQPQRLFTQHTVRHISNILGLATILFGGILIA